MVDFLIDLAAEIIGDVAGEAAEHKLFRQPAFRKMSPVTRFFLGLGAAAVMGLIVYAVVMFFIR